MSTYSIAGSSLANKPARRTQVDSTVKLPVRRYTRRQDLAETSSHLEKQKERDRGRETIERKEREIIAQITKWPNSINGPLLISYLINLRRFNLLTAVGHVKQFYI